MLQRSVRANGARQVIRQAAANVPTVYVFAFGAAFPGAHRTWEESVGQWSGGLRS